MKFNIINFNDSIHSSGKITLFSKEYNLKDKNNLRNFNNKLYNLLYFSYRTNFYQIQSLNSNNCYNSDCGWGCMLRSGQMLLARGIYKYLKNLNPINKNRKYEILVDTLCLFLDNPFYFNNNFPVMLNTFKEFIIKFKKFKNSEFYYFIKGIFAPFSIKSICNIGKLSNKFAGEWFSDVSMSFIFEKIVNNYKIFKNENENSLKFFSFHNSIDLNEILEKCFLKLDYYNSNININNKENKILNYNNNSYLFKNSGIIFVSCRLGLYEIEKIYYESLFFLFQSKNFLGFIGGKPNRAFYCIGIDQENNLIYLDPHFTQESINSCFYNIPKYHESYFKKNIYRIKISQIQPALTIGFIFRNVLEFNALINFLEVNNSFENKFYVYSFKNKNQVQDENLNKQIKEEIQNRENDF
jgi:cysteine protease ATG4